MLWWYIVVDYSNLHLNVIGTLHFTVDDLGGFFFCYRLFMLSAVTVHALFTLQLPL